MVSKSEHKRARTPGRAKYIRRRKIVTPPVPLPLPEASETAIAPISPASSLPCERCSTVEPHRHCECGTRLDGHFCGTCGRSALDAKTEVPPLYRKHDDSKVRSTAIQIVAMELGGQTREEIAQALNLSPRTIQSYLYIAAKNGWIDFEHPKDSIEFQILPKVVRNLTQGLDDDNRHATSGMTVGQQMALKIAEGTVFKAFDQLAGVQDNTLVGVKIEIVGGGQKDTVREGTVLGADSYVDAETVQE